MTVSCDVRPGARGTAGGLTAMDSSVGGPAVTMTVTVAVCPEATAVTVALPPPIPVTTPELLTAATVAALVEKATPLMTGARVPSL